MAPGATFLTTMTHHTRLLLVDDNPDDVELTLMALAQVGIAPEAITVAGDGVEVLELLLPHDSNPPALRPELILLDLNMPRMGGLEVLEQLQSHPATKAIPVVVLTTSDEERDLYRSYALGCNSYVLKPIDYSQFLQTLHYLGCYWLSCNQPPPAGSYVEAV